MLKYDNQSADQPQGTSQTPSLKLSEPPPAEGCPLKLALGDSQDAIRHVTQALGQAQRRLDNLHNLIDRFELDGDDDGPRAA